MNLKLFGKNAVIYATGNITLRASSFLLVPLYTYYLSIEDYGRLETVFVTIRILVVFTGLGIQSSVIRFYKESESNGEISKLLGSTLVVIGIGIFTFCSLFVLAFGTFFQNLLQSNVGNQLIVLVCFASIAECLTIYFLAFQRAQNKACEYAAYTISIAFLVVLLTVIFLSILKQGLPGVLTARTIGYVSIGTIIGFTLLRRVPLHFSKVKTQELFTFGFPLIFAASGWFILEGSDRYFLALFSGMVQVGIYALGYKLTFILLAVVVMPFELAYGPFVFANRNQPSLRKDMSRLFTYLILASVIVGYVIVLFSRDVINLIAPKEFEAAYLVTIYILPSVALQGIFYWSAAQLHITKNTSYIAIVVGIAAILNLALNYLLIPRYVWVGAAIATNISYFIAVGILIIIGFSVFPVPLELRRIGIVVVLGVGLGFSYLLTYNLSRHYFYFVNSSVILVIPVFLYCMRFFAPNEKLFIINLLAFKGMQR